MRITKLYFFIIFMVIIGSYPTLLASQVTSKEYMTNSSVAVQHQSSTTVLTIPDVLKVISMPKTLPKSNNSGIVVAVIDSGINKSVIPNYWINTKEIPNNSIDDDHNGYVDDYYGWDFVTNKPVAFTGPFSSHGTFISNIIASMTANVSTIHIMDIRVLNTQNKNSNFNSFIQAIQYALLFPSVKVIQFSIEFIQSFFDQYSQQLQWVFRKAFLRHVAIVSVTGNDASSHLSNPGNWSETLAVTSIQQSGNSWIKAPYANNGSNIDIAVPGTNIQSIGSNGKSLVLSGTSFSAAFVGGAVGLLEAEHASQNLSIETIRGLLQASADSLGNCLQFGAGILNVSKLLQLASSTTDSPPKPVCSATYTIPTSLGPKPPTKSLSYPFEGVLAMVFLVSSKKLKIRKLKSTLISQNLEK